VINQILSNDPFFHSIEWECLYSWQYLGHQILGNLYTDPISNDIEWTHPPAFASAASILDSPTLSEIQNMPSPKVDERYEAIDLEIAALKNKQNMVEIPRSQVPPGKNCQVYIGFSQKKTSKWENIQIEGKIFMRGDLQILDGPQCTFSLVVS
jgi:hypothetical protein